MLIKRLFYIDLSDYRIVIIIIFQVMNNVLFIKIKINTLLVNFLIIYYII